jgi:cytochrome c6
VRPVVFVAVACAGALILALAGCGTGGYVSSGSQGSGKKLFVQACGGCHTLADAGTSGNVGPNLDGVKPTRQKVVTQVTNGGGAMPAFKDTLDQQQIQAVADYVSSVAGK